MNEHILIADGSTLNPGDLNWKILEQFGHIHYFDRTSEDELIERCKSATVIITNKTPLSSAAIHAASNLKVIAVSATGYNIVDLQAAQERGVTVCNVPGYGTDSVAQHTFALILELANHVGKNADSVFRGEWSAAKDFCYTKAPIVELSGKTLGVVGYGSIGQKVAKVADAFGMKILYYSPSRLGKDPACVSLEDVFTASDVVTLHCPLTKENAGFVNAEMLSLMKPTSWLVNTARGQLINEPDLYVALRDGSITAAALDVLSIEPPVSGHPLIGLTNCIITPHNAWLSFEARQRILQTTHFNILNALNGTPQNEVR